jgi:hypothetical protein
MAVTINGNDDNFGQIQVGDIVYAVNAWGVNVQDTISPDFGNISWSVPCGAAAGTNCWEVPTLDQYPADVACQMCWTLTENVGNTFYVRAYPMMIFGSMGGRDTTWGAPKQGCDAPRQTGTLANSGRCNNSAVYDMRDPNAAIGLPVRVDQIATLSFCFDADPQCSGDPNNVENVFIDTYWHLINSAALWPTGYNPAWGELNRINENATEMWNLNFKLCLPEGLNADAATGGPNLLLADPTTYPGGCITIDGRSWEVHVKLEGRPCSRSTVDQTIAGHGWAPNAAPANATLNPCRNCFYYISFVPCGADGNGTNRGICGGSSTCINYAAFADFVKSQAFKDLVVNPSQAMPRDLYDNQGNLIESAAHFPRWIWEQVGEPPFPVDAPAAYALDGIALGNELWFSNAGQQSCACWSGVKFFTDRGEFGKRVTEDDPEPGVVCTTGVSGQVTTATDGGGACSPQSIVINGGTGIACGVGVANSLVLTNCCGTVFWTITGPGNVNIASSTSATTTFAVDAPGTYTITAECCT